MLQKSVVLSGIISCLLITSVDASGGVTAIAQHPNFNKSHPTMQDIISWQSFVGGGLIGMYDGHGAHNLVFEGKSRDCGRLCAEYAAEEIGAFAAQNWDAFLAGWDNRGSIRSLFSKIYTEVNAQLHSTIAGKLGGTTATTVLFKDECFWIAHVGDCRVLMIGKEAIRQLTIDHDLHNDAERDRVVRAGGSVCKMKGDSYRVRNQQGCSDLNVVRTLGDNRFNAGVISCEPEINAFAWAVDEFCMLVASDGIFECLSNSDVASIVRHVVTVKTAEDEPAVHIARHIAEAVVMNAFGSGSQDNLSVVVRYREDVFGVHSRRPSDASDASDVSSVSVVSLESLPSTPGALSVYAKPFIPRKKMVSPACAPLEELTEGTLSAEGSYAFLPAGLLSVL